MQSAHQQAAITSIGRDDEEMQEGSGVVVRQYLSAGFSVTLIDTRPDEDGFGLADSDPILLSEAANWIETHPGVELTGIHAGYDALGRRQLVLTGDGDPGGNDGRSVRTAHLVAVPEQA